jgi:hypothetical protein
MADDVALTPELEKLGPPIETPEPIDAPAKARRKRSGTSGAERARRAKDAAGTATAAPKPRARAPRRTAPAIGAGMANLYTMAGMAVAFVPSGPAVAGSGFDGQTITGAVGSSMVANSAQLGAVWEKAAKDDPRIREALEKLLAVSTVGQIVAAHVPLVMAGMIAAGAVPAHVLAAMSADAPAPDGNNQGGRP